MVESFRDEERRWKKMQEILAAEASGKTVRPTVSQRTLFGIPSTMEQTIERIVAEDEQERREKRKREAEKHENGNGAESLNGEADDAPAMSNNDAPGTSNDDEPITPSDATSNDE